MRQFLWSLLKVLAVLCLLLVALWVRSNHTGYENVWQDEVSDSPSPQGRYMVHDWELQTRCGWGDVRIAYLRESYDGIAYPGQHRG